MAWQAMVWVGLLASLAVAERDLDAEPDTSSSVYTARSWVEGEKVNRENDLKLRLTGGIGISNYLLSMGGRVLRGKYDGHLVYGFQALILREIQFGPAFDEKTYPDRALTSCHALLGADVFSDGAVSWLWLGGLGVSFARGPMNSRGYDPSNRNATTSTTHPSIVLASDFGVSIQRHVGLSLQAGAVVSREVSKFLMLQLDVGSW